MPLQMMIPNRMVFLVFSFFILSSCNEEKEMRDFIMGVWIVKKVTIDNQDYESTYFLLNSIDFNDDNSCTVPIMKGVENDRAYWVLKKNRRRKGAFICEITGSKESLFNNEYEIIVDQNNTESRIRLKSKRITFYCARVNLK